MIQSALCFAFSSNASVPLPRCSRLSSYIFRPYRFIRSTASSSLRQQSSAHFPRDVRPLRHKIISVLSGITGSPALGTFKGRRLEPSASTSTKSAREQASLYNSQPVNVIFPFSAGLPATARPRRSRTFLISSALPSNTPNAPGRAIWVVVTTRTLSPRPTASQASLRIVDVLPPAPARDTTKGPGPFPDRACFIRPLSPRPCHRLSVPVHMPHW